MFTIKLTSIIQFQVISDALLMVRGWYTLNHHGIPCVDVRAVWSFWHHSDQEYHTGNSNNQDGEIDIEGYYRIGSRGRVNGVRDSLTSRFKCTKQSTRSGRRSDVSRESAKDPV